MISYSVVVETATDEVTGWVPAGPPEAIWVDESVTALTVAHDTRYRRNLDAGEAWRIRVWTGPRATGPADAEIYVEDLAWA